MPRVWGKQDIAYARRLEKERNELVGPTASYYSLKLYDHVDALYGEPTNDPLYGGDSPMGTDSKNDESWAFRQPKDIVCTILYQEMDNRTPSVRDEGMEAEYDAEITISRDEWECKMESTVKPKEGDVLYLFEEWWDVAKANKGGNHLDTVETVGFKLGLTKRTKFDPRRKISEEEMGGQ